MMAHSTHAASLPTDALQGVGPSPARAVARRLELVQRLRKASTHRDDPAFQRRVDTAVAAANAALAAGDTATGDGASDDAASGGTDRLEAVMRALDALTFELCED